LLLACLSLIPVYAYGGSEPVVLQQQKKIVGIVIDEKGEPIIGANIIVKGATANGTITDMDGKFQLNVPPNATLAVSFIGFATREVVVNNQNDLRITLAEDRLTLDEIIVVGYGAQRKESLTGALQSLKSEKIITTTTPSIENMLSGKVAGVFVAPGGGTPGSRGSVVIRGKTSLNGTVSPLWVIDGVIVGTDADYSLNPNDVETMTILKDAASTAIYGSQGANGVIVVTTKSSKSEKITVNASAKFGINNLSNGNMQVMTGTELYDYFQTFDNVESVSFLTPDVRNRNYDWWKLATRTGTAQDYNVSLSGGSEKVKSFFSAGYYDEQGAVKGYGFSQYSARFRSEYKPTKWLSVKPAVSGSRRDIDDSQYSINEMYSQLPWDSPYDSKGNPTPHRSSSWINSQSTNNIYDLQWNYTVSSRYSLMGNLDFDIRFNDWLTFSSINSITWTDYYYHGYEDPRSNGGEGVNGRITETGSNTTRRYTNQILRFNRSFDKHVISALAAYEFNDYTYRNYELKGTGFVSGMDVINVAANMEKWSSSYGILNESAMQSVLFNAHYAYDNKYLAQFSLRRDGASNFGDNAKYGNFFSISGGWLINKEEFFKAKWVDQLKLRASYGSTGNRPDALYPQYDLYTADTKASYNGSSGVLISQIGNKDLTWEKTYTLGIGIDLSFLERFRLNMDYYDKNTSNVLYTVPVSGLVGVTSVWKNIAEISNTGLEVTLGADVVRAKDWSWTIDVNLGTNTNKVIKLYDDKTNSEGLIAGVNNVLGSASKILKPGYSSDTYFLPEWGGVDPEDGSPQWYKTDEDGNRVITKNYSEAGGKSRITSGSYNPDLFGGFSTNVAWKQLDLNAIFGFSIGGKIYNYARQEYDADGTYSDRNQMKLKDGWSRWTKPGDIATHPKASYNNQSKANNVSTRYLESGDYLKLRSLSLGYNLNLKRYKIENMRLSLTGENLLTFTPYSGVNPEITTYNGTVVGANTASPYPVTRKFMLGLSFTF
jgi:TonB-linked SusC/RagA family outer membrane protein